MRKPDAWKVQSGRYYHYCDTRADAEMSGRDTDPPAAITPLFALTDDERAAIELSIEDFKYALVDLEMHGQDYKAVGLREKWEKHIAALAGLLAKPSQEKTS